MLDTLKNEVCEIAKKAQRDGLCKHKSGNFSARDQESGYIVITPTSVDRERLTPEDMIVMDLDANVIENGFTVSEQEAADAAGDVDSWLADLGF